MTPAAPRFWIDWLCRDVLPLWSEAGFDARRGSFVERLSLDRTPQHDVPRRVMVQARQIFVFATAARNGWFPGGAELADHACDTMIRHYGVSGGRGGWVFSCDRHGRCVDDRRDLYAHAFVLLALASRIALDPHPRLIALVHATLAFLDHRLAHPAGGYREHWPGAAPSRRQNPHMHLLEAFLALQAGGHCGDFARTIAQLLALFDRHFLATQDDVLSEYYGPDWTSDNPHRTFEPGHHYEWAWLLARHARMTGTATDDRIDRLLHGALRGIDSLGRVVDVMGPGGPVVAACRLWPAMEAAKALDTHQGRMASPGGTAAILAAAWPAFFATAPRGGWIDRVDQRGGALVDHMPASSLYHICTALDALR